MITGIFLFATLLAGAGVFYGFLALERAGRQMTTVLIILGLLVIECIIYPDPNNIPAGLFHPGVGGSSAEGGTDYGLSFRLPDLVIPIALMARMIARGWPLRLHAASLWWAAFALWLFVSAVVGFRNGNGRDLIVYEGKIIVYLGFLALAAGVPAAEYAHGRLFRRFLIASSAAAALVIVVGQTGARLALSIPGFQIKDIGSMGSDSATIFLALGLMALAIGICSEDGRFGLLMASTALFFASVAAQQRAALVALAASSVTFVVVAALGWRRVRTSLTELALVGMAFGALLLMPLVFSASFGSREPVVPVVGDVAGTFTSYSKHLSAQSRRYQWRKAKELIGESPAFGSGLGTNYEHYDPGPKKFVTTNLTHNIALDLLLRAGAIGVGLFAVALMLTLRDGVRTWLKHRDALIAAVALGTTAAIVGLLGKGMVESIFEKYRLATMLGFLLGVVASSTLSLMEPVAKEATDRTSRTQELAWS